MSKDGRFHRNGPANNPEPAPQPKPKVKKPGDCLGCNKGKVLTADGIKDCRACKGKGTI